MIRIARAQEARQLLASDSFLKEWSALYALCPWKTAFQSAAFACSWYQSYSDAFEPLFVLARSSAGHLVGLFALATGPGQNLICAGGHQAEYQGWLATPESGQEFFERAIAGLSELYPRSRLTLRYLPPGAPVNWALPQGALENLCQLEAVRRPLIRLDDRDHIERSLRSKNMRACMNRLKRLGEFRFEQIIETGRFERVFDTVIDYYDGRQGKTKNCRPFQEDSRKKPFHLRLMSIPALLHVTAITVGEQLISAHLGLSSPDTTHMLIPAHAPALSKEPLGRLHLLLLARLLSEAGQHSLDLTPDENLLKTQLATDFDTVHLVTVFFSRRAKIVHDGKEKITAFTKRTLSACGLRPHALKGFVRKLRHAVTGAGHRA